MVDWAAPDAFGSWQGSEATGNALAQLDVRTNSKFLTAFLRHFQLRIQEFSAELVELFSPLFVVQ